MFHTDEDLTDTSHKKVMLAMSRKTDWETLARVMDDFHQAVESFDTAVLRSLILTLVPEMTQQERSELEGKTDFVETVPTGE